MADPMAILGDFYNAINPRKVLATHVDPNTGQFVDAQGNPTTEYQNPGFFGRFLSPEARQTWDLNQANQAQALDAVKHRAIARNVAGLDWGTLSPEVQKTLGGNQDQAITMTGGNFGGQNDEQVGQSISDINSGLPAANTTANLAGAGARTAEGNYQNTFYNTQNLLGTPETAGQGADWEAQNALERARGMNPIIPKELTDTSLGYENSIARKQGEARAIPAQNATLFNTSSLGEKITGQQLADAPITLGTMKANDLFQNYEAVNNPNLMLDPHAGYVDINSGKLYPHQYRSPEMKAFDAMNSTEGMHQVKLADGSMHWVPNAVGASTIQDNSGTSQTPPATPQTAPAVPTTAPAVGGQSFAAPQQERTPNTYDDGAVPVVAHAAAQALAPAANYVNRKSTLLDTVHNMFQQPQEQSEGQPTPAGDSAPMSLPETGRAVRDFYFGHPQNEQPDRITRANIFDEVAQPTNGPQHDDGTQHIMETGVNDAVQKQLKLVKAVAKQYGTHSPQYKEVYLHLQKLAHHLPAK